MPDSSWKSFERRIAKLFGGKRRGADYRSEQGGKDDVVHGRFSIECKLLGRPSYSDLLDAARQAERNSPPDRIPIAIIKRKHADDRDSLVVMRLETFLKYEPRPEEPNDHPDPRT